MDIERQRRGAWRAGYEQGYADGEAARVAEAWQAIAGREDVKVGDTIKMIVETICGWKGRGRVTHVCGPVITFQKLDGPNAADAFSSDDWAQFLNQGECLFHEALVLRQR